MTLLRQYGASPGASVVAVTWRGILPFALRKELHTPVLVDAVSFFILVALLLAARPNRYLAFSGLLVFGVLARESLLVRDDRPHAVLALRGADDERVVRRVEDHE